MPWDPPLRVRLRLKLPLCKTAAVGDRTGGARAEGRVGGARVVCVGKSTKYSDVLSSPDVVPPALLLSAIKS